MSGKCEWVVVAECDQVWEGLGAEGRTERATRTTGVGDDPG